MKLPNGERAVVDIVKLRDYCLSEEHPRGKHKARVFKSALGMTADDAETLRTKLLEAVRTGQATSGEADKYGQRYVLDFTLEWKGKTATVRSAWIVRTDEDFPRLTSCYVMKE